MNSVCQSKKDVVPKMDFRFQIRNFERAVGIGTTFTVLYLLILIARSGEVVIYEKVSLILFTEIMFLSLGLGIMLGGFAKNE